MKVQMNIFFNNIVSILVNSVYHVIEDTIKYLRFVQMSACLYTLQTKLVQMVESKLKDASIYFLLLFVSSKYFILNLQDNDEVLDMVSYKVDLPLYDANF